jgi:hypothetical protein
MDCQVNFNVAKPTTDYLQKLDSCIMRNKNTLVLDLADTPDSFLTPEMIERKREEGERKLLEENKRRGETAKKMGVMVEAYSERRN